MANEPGTLHNPLLYRASRNKGNLLLTVAHQAPLSMGFSRPECWSGLPFPPPGDLLHAGTEPESPASPALQAGSSPAEPSGEARRASNQLFHFHKARSSEHQPLACISVSLLTDLNL